MEIKIKKLYEDSQIPTRGSEQAAGYDLYAHLEDGEAAFSLSPHQTTLVGTGIAIEIPKGYFGAVYARSGLACKNDIRPENCVGVIDSDYRGEIKVALHNDNNMKTFIVEKDMRIAQLVIMPYLNVEFKEVEDLDDTNRGQGGFGSTGA